MNDKKTTADYAPNEKKVWRPESAVPFTPDPALKMKPGIYVLAIEELQGAWVDGKWEEADSSEEWTETETVTTTTTKTDSYIDEDGVEHTVVTEEVAVTETVSDFSKEIPRSRRYTVKEITDTGFARNAFSDGFSGPRKYTK